MLKDSYGSIPALKRSFNHFLTDKRLRCSSFNRNIPSIQVNRKARKVTLHFYQALRRESCRRTCESPAGPRRVRCCDEGLLQKLYRTDADDASSDCV